MPQIYYENIKTNCNACIYFWHITESCDELSKLIADNGILLAKAQDKFKAVNRQREWLATRALLQQTPYNEEEILYKENGQPYLAGNYMSISHTKDYAAIAISEEPIGIDIEKRGRNAQAAAKIVLQPHEIEETPAEEMLHMWVVKEAAFKFAPERANTLIDISAEKCDEGYSISYPDGSTATCRVHILDNIILACCTRQ